MPSTSPPHPPGPSAPQAPEPKMKQPLPPTGPRWAATAEAASLRSRGVRIWPATAAGPPRTSLPSRTRLHSSCSSRPGSSQTQPTTTPHTPHHRGQERQPPGALQALLGVGSSWSTLHPDQHGCTAPDWRAARCRTSPEAAALALALALLDPTGGSISKAITPRWTPGCW